MAYWLFKSEPNTWSWEQQKARGDDGEPWNGVRNYQANNNMKAMKIGDKGFFYHSVEQKAVVGVVEVCREHYPDHTDATGRFGMVDIKAIADAPTPFTLADVKGEPRLQETALLKQSRLSVQPITPEEWKIMCAMAGFKKLP